MKKGLVILLSCFFYVLLTNQAFAHFGMIIPSDSMIMQGDNRGIRLNVSFSHPFENINPSKVFEGKCWSSMVKCDILKALERIRQEDTHGSKGAVEGKGVGARF